MVRLMHLRIVFSFIEKLLYAQLQCLDSRCEEFFEQLQLLRVSVQFRDQNELGGETLLNACDPSREQRPVLDQERAYLEHDVIHFANTIDRRDIEQLLLLLIHHVLCSILGGLIELQRSDSAV